MYIPVVGLSNRIFHVGSTKNRAGIAALDGANRVVGNTSRIYRVLGFCLRPMQ